eukprot:9491626-Pyramimonas_sp.AAC.3
MMGRCLHEGRIESFFPFLFPFFTSSSSEGSFFLLRLLLLALALYSLIGELFLQALLPLTPPQTNLPH